MFCCRVTPLFVLLALASAGCLPLTSAYSRRDGRSLTNPFGLRTVAGQDKNVFRYVLLDQPLGDPYLSSMLWNTTLQPLPPEKAAILNENGIRVGVFPTNPPAELLELINNSQTALKPHDLTVTNGQEKSIPVTAVVPKAEYREVEQLGTEGIAREFTNTQFGFSFSIERADDGKIRIRAMPTAQHGARQGWLRPTLDETGFNWLDQKKSERFAALAWDVTVTPGDFVIVGSTEQPAQKPGGAWFVTQDADSPRMHVLILRAWPSTSSDSLSVPGQKQSRSTR